MGESLVELVRQHPGVLEAVGQDFSAVANEMLPTSDTLPLARYGSEAGVGLAFGITRLGAYDLSPTRQDIPDGVVLWTNRDQYPDAWKAKPGDVGLFGGDIGDKGRFVAAIFGKIRVLQVYDRYTSYVDDLSLLQPGCIGLAGGRPYDEEVGMAFSGLNQVDDDAFCRELPREINMAVRTPQQRSRDWLASRIEEHRLRVAKRLAGLLENYDDVEQIPHEQLGPALGRMLFA